jgi:hypothetical protein
MTRVFPTGKCFCGCGEATEGTSYFMPGHDKKAEAKVVKEVYGGVIEFLAAHGYGPEGRDPSAASSKGTDMKGLDLLVNWSKQEGFGQHTHVALELLNMEDRGGARQRFELFHVSYSPKERAFRFERCSSGSKPGAEAMTLTVPLPDIEWVYFERSPQNRNGEQVRVVRLRGAISGDPAPRFLPFG